ncbi:MAG TPA: protein kinase [Candidatus Eisenbacteria bacterium]|jgi:Tol biopolymer transport system component/predicted Ser/Thr protein kinase
MITTSVPSRLGPYPIERELGRGGMGVVYLGRDTRLDRPVAIKVLPEALGHDPERLARFEREAKILASLNHPNIAGIYGLEEADGRRFLALEFVGGETLAERLARGRIPVDDALEICCQIASALEAAHESGVVHRDLKPGNVKITGAGEVKVLDFGLAKGSAEANPGSGPDLSQSPTLTYAMTGAGVILGTAGYMSPEQARGKVVDRRTDIWSFGCVLYECLAAQQLFAGETVSDTIAKILEREPDWGSLPATTSAKVRDLLRRCLEKDAKKRLRDIGDARIEIEEALAARTTSIKTAAAAAATPAARRTRAQSRLAWALVAVLAMATVALALPRLFQRSLGAHPVRFTIGAPVGATLVEDAMASAISPDGRTLAFLAVDSSGTASLWVRRLGSLVASPLSGTENALLPFWSADNRFLAFFADGKLKKIPAGGGAVEVLCEANNGRGASWSRDDVILFAPAGEGPLVRVSASGGEVVAATTLDSARHETGHRSPCFLPDGRSFLYAALPARQGKLDIYLGTLGSQERRLLMTAEGAPIYAEPGYLLSRRNGALAAQRFDKKSKKLAGEPISIGEALSGPSFDGAPNVSASAAGVVAHLSGNQANTDLVWLDRSGRRTGVVAVPPGRYEEFDVSPDGSRLALVRANSPASGDIWLVELARGVMTRFTFGPSRNGHPLWSPDSKRIVFSSDRDGPWNLYVKSVGGTGREEALHQSRILFKHPRQWSYDGRLIVYGALEEKTGWDLWTVSVDGDRTPVPYLRTPFNEPSGSISPDGRWMAYESDESGRYEIYVQSFPIPDTKYQVSTGGGFGSGWSEDGKELIFAGPDGLTAMTVDVQTGEQFRAGIPRALFRAPPGLVGATMTRDNRRCLVSVPANRNAASSIEVLLDWTAVLPKR